MDFGSNFGGPGGVIKLTFGGLFRSWGRLGAKLVPRPLQESLRDRFSMILSEMCEAVRGAFGGTFGLREFVENSRHPKTPARVREGLNCAR